MSFNDAAGTITNLVSLGLVAGIATKTIDLVDQNTKSTKKKSKGDVDLMMGFDFGNTGKKKGKKQKAFDPYEGVFDNGYF